MKTIIFKNGDSLTIEPEQYIYLKDWLHFEGLLILRHKTGTEIVLNPSEILYIK